jgi:hypothetical protein
MATLLIFMAAGLISQAYRYRHLATPTQRQQTKWVLLGLGIQFLWILWLILWLSEFLTWLGITDPMIAFVMLHLTLVAVAALPVAIGISILRYRLWDIDLLINRALVFGGLTLLVASAYVLIVGLFGVLFRLGNNLALSILATGLVAILFHPLRQRLQQTINRFMYGERDDPATVLSRLGERLARPFAILPGRPSRPGARVGTSPVRRVPARLGPGPAILPAGCERDGYPDRFRESFEFLCQPPSRVNGRVCRPGAVQQNLD